MANKLHIFRQIAKTGPAAPDRFLLFEAGWVEVEGSEPFLIDEQSFEAIAGEFHRRGNDLVIDYEHRTLDGDKAPAAGWITDLIWDPEAGIIAEVEWTDAARDHLEKREYRYHSPVFYVRESDKRVISIHSVALTNSPRTNRIRPIAAKKEDTVELLKLIIAALGLPEDATEDQAVEAMKALKAKADQPPEPQVRETIPREILDALGVEGGADKSTVVASIHALSKGTGAMVPRAEFEALRAQIAEQTAETLVAKAMSDGKVTPAQKEWAVDYAARDPEGFKLYLSKMPRIVPTEPLPPATRRQANPLDDAAVKEVAAKMGTDPADIMKYGVDKEVA
jgi:phage I-like protein